MGPQRCRELGDGTLTDRHTPVRVSGLTNVIAIAASRDSSMALKSDGSVWYWGYFYGISSTNYDRVPKQMTELGYNNIKIAMGEAYILTVDQDGYVWGIGATPTGRLAIPAPTRMRIPPSNSTICIMSPPFAPPGISAVAKTDAATLTGNIRLEGLSRLTPTLTAKPNTSR